MMLTVFKWCLSGPVGQRSRDQGRVGRPLSIASFFHKVVGFLAVVGVTPCFGMCWKIVISFIIS